MLHPLRKESLEQGLFQTLDHWGSRAWLVGSGPQRQAASGPKEGDPNFQQPLVAGGSKEGRQQPLLTGGLTSAAR